MNAREVYHALRRGGMPCQPRIPAHLRELSVHHNINARAPYRAILDRCEEDGKIGVIRSGMDCDCTQYYSERVIAAPSGAFAFCREEEAHCDSLDGPESVHFDKPSNIEVQHKSRDRALEAYEDGRPNLILWGSMDD